MVSKQIIDSDAFLDMSPTSQLLYFHLIMRADDEGFVGNPKKIMREIGIQADDFKILIAKRFLIAFESGVVVIKHWLIHNTIRMDRFNETSYQDEKNMLDVKQNKAYTEMATTGIPTGNQMEPQVKLSKVKLIKDSTESLSFLDKIDDETIREMTTRFRCDDAEVKTKAHALADYCRAKGKKYKDYRAMLGNALRKDFGERPPQRKVEIIDGIAHIRG